MSSHTPAGQMMTFASEITKDYALKYLVGVRHGRAHRDGDIHIHDLDYYPTKTTTCIQYDLGDIYERGFSTKNGSVRTPQSIQSYATLATIVFQTNQNEQHGGQSIPAFDHFMAPGVLKTFRRHLTDMTLFLCGVRGGVTLERAELKALVAEHVPTIEPCETAVGRLFAALRQSGVEVADEDIRRIWRQAYDTTRRETHQAMEGFIHNLNTMHSARRQPGGVQLGELRHGLFARGPHGHPRTAFRHDRGAGARRSAGLPDPDFQGQGGRFVVRRGLCRSGEGLRQGTGWGDQVQNSELRPADRGVPHHVGGAVPQLHVSRRTVQPPRSGASTTPTASATRWRRWGAVRASSRICTAKSRRGGRGNLSFTSMNLPRLAIEAMREAGDMIPDGNKHAIRKEAREIFLESVRKTATMMAEQLYERYCFQRTALARQFPFMMSNDVWKGGGRLQPNDEVGDVLKHGTLGIGFIGGHNAMVAIYGEGHATSKEAWQTLYDAVTVMNRVVEEYKAKYGLNYSVLATPAEGLSGRFTRMDRKRYGEIPGVTDRDYYVNSFHVDVREPVSIVEKIRLEAPFHAITRGGHITYVELDGEARKNPVAILKIVKVMQDEGIGYGSINHPIDTCRKCGHRGVIYSKCPVCGSDDILRMRRITGYLTGSLESWNSAKQAEERDRVKHR